MSVYDINGKKIGSLGGITDEAKTAFLNCFRHIAFLDKDADYYENF